MDVYAGKNSPRICCGIGAPACNKQVGLDLRSGLSSVLCVQCQGHPLEGGWVSSWALPRQNPAVSPGAGALGRKWKMQVGDGLGPQGLCSTSVGS